MTPEVLYSAMRVREPTDPHAYHLHDVVAEIKATRKARRAARRRRWAEFARGGSGVIGRSASVPSHGN
jgi:hypothetical protein